MVTKKKAVDFTLREPEHAKKTLEWCNRQLEAFLKEAKRNNYSASDIKTAKGIWSPRNKMNQWQKVVLSRDISRRGVVVARKGDTVWAQYQPRYNGSLPFDRDWTKKQEESYRAAHWLIAIHSPRKIDPRPRWKGQRDAMFYGVSFFSVKPVA